MTRLAAPDSLDRWPAPFAPCFTRSGRRHALVLVAGAILAPGRRTVASALRAVGLGETAGCTNCHRVLNRNPWRGRWLAGRLLEALVRAFVPDGPAVVGIDATLERRWGPRIRARGIYRDPVRASHQHFIKASGLRWQAVMRLVPVPWAKRVWALPFLTILAPSERYAREHGRRHKSLTDWARQGLLQVARWLPGREIVAVGDNGYAVIELLAAARRHGCMVTRLRLDARLFDPAPARQPGTMGRPRVVGRRQPNLAARLDDPAAGWRRLRVGGWYRGEDRELDVHSGTAVWYHTGLPPVPIRYVLVRDPRGELRPQAFLCTDLDADPLDVRRWFVRRWATEVTCAEVRRHRGVETQRQWSDEAIARTTPSLLGLFSLVALWAHELHAVGRLRPRQASWYVKGRATFSDALAAVRRCLWTTATFPTSADPPERAEVPRGLLNALTAAACYPA